MRKLKLWWVEETASWNTMDRVMFWACGPALILIIVSLIIGWLTK